MFPRLEIFEYVRGRFVGWEGRDGFYVARRSYISLVR